MALSSVRTIGALFRLGYAQELSQILRREASRNVRRLSELVTDAGELERCRLRRLTEPAIGDSRSRPLCAAASL